MYTILMMDENPAQWGMLKQMIARSGIKVELMKPVRDILALVKIKKPHLIVLGYLMGDANGGELCSMLKNDPSTRHLPVIIFSEYDRVFQSLGDYGCNLFLPKTSLRSNFVSATKKLLSKYYEQL